MILVGFGFFESYTIPQERYRFATKSFPKVNLDHELTRIAFVEGAYKQSKTLNVCLLEADQCYHQSMAITDTYDLVFTKSALAYVHMKAINVWDYEQNTVQQVPIPHPVSRLFSIDEQHIVFSHDQTLYTFDRDTQVLDVLYTHSHLIRDAVVMDDVIVVYHSEKPNFEWVPVLTKVTAHETTTLTLPAHCLNGAFTDAAFFVIGCQNTTMYVPLDSFKAVGVLNSGGQLIVTMNETTIYSTLGPADPTEARRSTEYSTVYATDLHSGRTSNLRIPELSIVYQIQALENNSGFILSGTNQQDESVVTWYEAP